MAYHESTMVTRDLNLRLLPFIAVRNFSYFKPHSLWPFVIAVATNEHRKVDLKFETMDEMNICVEQERASNSFCHPSGYADLPVSSQSFVLSSHFLVRTKATSSLLPTFFSTVPKSPSKPLLSQLSVFTKLPVFLPNMCQDRTRCILHYLQVALNYRNFVFPFFPTISSTHIY